MQERFNKLLLLEPTNAVSFIRPFFFVFNYKARLRYSRRRFQLCLYKRSWNNHPTIQDKNAESNIMTDNEKNDHSVGRVRYYLIPRLLQRDVHASDHEQSQQKIATVMQTVKCPTALSSSRASSRRNLSSLLTKSLCEASCTEFYETSWVNGEKESGTLTPARNTKKHCVPQDFSRIYHFSVECV